jgi:hypothetical protein
MRSKLAKKFHREKPTREDLERKPWRTRGSIAGLRVREPSKRHLVDSSSALLVAKLCDEVVRHCQGNGFTNLNDCPQYEFLMQLCYAIGFVAGDMRLMEGRPYQDLVTGRTRVENLDFPDLRCFIHMLWRAERHSDIGEATGGGHVIDAARSGALAAVATRIRQLVKGAGQS